MKSPGVSLALPLTGVDGRSGVRCPLLVLLPFPLTMGGVGTSEGVCSDDRSGEGLIAGCGSGLWVSGGGVEIGAGEGRELRLNICAKRDCVVVVVGVC